MTKRCRTKFNNDDNDDDDDDDDDDNDDDDKDDYSLFTNLGDKGGYPFSLSRDNKIKCN